MAEPDSGRAKDGPEPLSASYVYACHARLAQTMSDGRTTTSPAASGLQIGLQKWFSTCLGMALTFVLPEPARHSLEGMPASTQDAVPQPLIAADQASSP